MPQDHKQTEGELVEALERIKGLGQELGNALGTLKATREQWYAMKEELAETKKRLQHFLTAKCPACGYQGEFTWMKADKGYVAEPGEYWCPACNTTLDVAHLQDINEKLTERLAWGGK